MEEVDLSKPFSVDIFRDDGPIDQSPWLCIGEFDAKEDAIEACKRVVEDFLRKCESQSESANTLIFNYLNYGPVPCINGTENLTTFELYEYLNRRCLELGRQ